VSGEKRAARLRLAVRSKYREIAREPAGHFPYPIGRGSALGLGYEPGWLDAAPGEVVDRFVGVGNPFVVERPAPGEAVLDVGCGCGLDVFVAARWAERAVGLDLTSEMLAVPGVRARFVHGSAEAIPFPDARFDLVISNGALNLVPDKDRAFREIARVLRPGGRLAVADLLVEESVPKDLLEDMDAWST
jgi:SAM-dependent methyltransferase